MRLIVCTSQAEEAPKLARILIEERLAACVNVIPAVKSHYIWEGKLEESTESMLFIKTTANMVQRLSERLRTLHSYEVPEIISIEILSDEGNQDYHQWLRNAVRAL